MMMSNSVIRRRILTTSQQLFLKAEAYRRSVPATLYEIEGRPTTTESRRISTMRVFFTTKPVAGLAFLLTSSWPSQKRHFSISTADALTMQPSLTNVEKHIPFAKKAMDYFDSSPDPFHAVSTSCKLLEEAGFVELDESGPYVGSLSPGGKYYFTKNRSTLVAFSIGEKYKPGNGFKVIGGHTDSPNLKIKPRSKKKDNPTHKTKQVAVECYGGGLWHTWFDRDLGISGRVFIRNSETGSIEQKLVKLDRAILRIPNLAIHLQTAQEREAFKVNKEDHLVPIIATAAENILNGEEAEKGKKSTTKDGWTEYQEPLLLKLISHELDIETDDIVDFELNLFDTQCASLGGIYNEFINSARLDNLASCFIAVEALCDHSMNELEDDEDISLIAIFDHEEVGSTSATGAGSPIMGEAVKKISTALNAGEGNSDLYSTAISKSFVLSVDQAHAIHPNYAGKHEAGHQPMMNQGMVIKRNSNQRYATNTVTGLLMKEVARKTPDVPVLQEFVVRNDCGCGSTIGPLISSNTGIRAIDMGCPQLSMHSIRETMGVSDLTHGFNLFKGFLKHFREVDNSVTK